MSASAAAIRVADHLRLILFQHVLRDGRDVRHACELILRDQRVKIPFEVAEVLVREEVARRSAVEQQGETAKLADAIREVPVVTRQLLDLPPGRGHKARIEYSKGSVWVTCSCGGRVCRLPRSETLAIEHAWFEHRDGIFPT